ncbi:MAG: ABC transporter permease [Thermoplasmata archaeon]|nr:ABC transporter permease [Thermoplasmata archaeon]
MKEIFSMAIKQLSTRKLRTILTVLAIVIGISAVVGITSVGEGVRIQVINRIRESGDLTTIDVHHGYDDYGNFVPIKESDVDYIEDIPHVISVCAFVKDVYVTANYNTYLPVKGAELSGLIGIYDLSLNEGYFFNETSDGENSTEIVLGSDIANKLSKRENIVLNSDLEAMIKLYITPEGVTKNVTFEVVGILKESGYDDIDNYGFIYLETAKELDEKGEMYDDVIVKADGTTHTMEVKKRITKDLNLQAHCLQDEIESANRFAGVVTLALGFFSGISLIVGALMIINTMIIAVHERTKEIGIMKAIGASDNDIMKLFMAECLLIGVLGGIFGDICGVLFSFAIDIAGRGVLANWLGVEGSLEHITAITPMILLTGFAISIVLSILAGLYPARRASRLSPVEALGHV